MNRRQFSIPIWWSASSEKWTYPNPRKIPLAGSFTMSNPRAVDRSRIYGDPQHEYPGFIDCLSDVTLLSTVSPDRRSKTKT